MFNPSPIHNEILDSFLFTSFEETWYNSDTNLEKNFRSFNAGVTLLIPHNIISGFNYYRGWNWGSEIDLSVTHKIVISNISVDRMKAGNQNLDKNNNKFLKPRHVSKVWLKMILFEQNRFCSSASFAKSKSKIMSNFYFHQNWSILKRTFWSFYYSFQWSLSINIFNKTAKSFSN